MKNLAIVCFLVATLLGASFLSYAGKPPGLEKQGKTPPGSRRVRKLAGRMTILQVGIRIAGMEIRKRTTNST